MKEAVPEHVRIKRIMRDISEHEAEAGARTTNLRQIAKELMEKQGKICRCIRCREIGLNEGLHYVYVGNIPGDSGENTLCPNCGKLVIERVGFAIRQQHMTGGNCQHCQAPLAGIF